MGSTPLPAQPVQPAADPRLDDRFSALRPFEQMEVALVRGCLDNPELLTPEQEALVRSALSLCRMYAIRHRAKDVDVEPLVAQFRDQVRLRLQPALLGDGPVKPEALAPQLPWVREQTLAARDALLAGTRDVLPTEVVDRELREKALVLVAGGGGGTGYIYLGVMSALDDLGLKPKLMAGTSIGAILCLFRARVERFDQIETVNIVRGLSWKKLFRAISMESRYGLPAALRLFLRAGIGRYFNAGPESSGASLKLSDLPIPTLISVSGIRRGMLPRPLEFYESLFNLGARSLLQPLAMAKAISAAVAELAEFVTHPEVMVKLTLGEDEGTRDFDALDAAGFSSALPGVIHYDVLRDNPEMTGLLDALFESRGLFRLIDGGLTDNLPAKAAWRAVHQGRIATRNAFVLGLNAFATKLSNPLWIPLERLAELTIGPQRPYAHLIRDFKQTLSPLELVPSLELVGRAIALGRKQIEPDLPFIRRMLTPLPPLAR